MQKYHRSGQACISLRQVHQAQVGVRRTPTTVQHAKRNPVVDPTVSTPDLAKQQEEAARAHADLKPGCLDLTVGTLECWVRN